MSRLAKPPNGRLDRIKAGDKSITIQTEFFESPAWRIEMKIYVDGALKKLENVPLDGTPEEELQKAVDRTHEGATRALLGKLKAQQDQKGDKA